MSHPVVFMFSGQGSQYYQMGRELFEKDEAFKRRLLELDAVASRLIGESVIDVVYDDRRRKSDPFERIRYSSVAIYMVECALVHTLREQGVVPDYVLGASLGTYSAAACAGAMDVEEGLEMVIGNSRAIESSCSAGGMLAVLANPDVYRRDPWLQDHSEIAGVNFTSHFVLAAPAEHLNAIEQRLVAQKIDCVPLSVAYAFHSKWIEVAEQSLRATLAGRRFQPLSLPLLCCAQARQVTTVTEDLLWRAVREPICFQQTIEALERQTTAIYVDVGPSGTLATFLKYASWRQRHHVSGSSVHRKLQVVHAVQATTL